MFGNHKYQGLVITIFQGSENISSELLKFGGRTSFYLGIPLAHFLEMDLAAHKVDALCNSGMLFQTLAIIFEAKFE